MLVLRYIKKIININIIHQYSGTQTSSAKTSGAKHHVSFMCVFVCYFNLHDTQNLKHSKKNVHMYIN